MKQQKILFFLVLTLLASPAFAQDTIAGLNGYTPPPMFETQGYDDAEIRDSVGYRDPIDQENLSKIIVPQEQENSAPPLPPHRPAKFSMSKAQAEKIKRDYEKGVREKPVVVLPVPNTAQKQNQKTDHIYGEDLVDPSAEDILNFIDPQN